MTIRRELEHRRDQYRDIREIMNAMKNLALMETHKLAHYTHNQSELAQGIETVACDFLHFHPYAPNIPSSTHTAWLVFGSERGFCGDFNEKLLAELRSAQRSNGAGATIAVGRKLGTLLERETIPAEQIDGATVTDEIGAVLTRVVAAIDELHARHGALRLTALFFDESGEFQKRGLLPPFANLAADRPPSGTPPELTLAVDYFFAELVDHYLFACLYEVAYRSFMAENRDRIQHMEAALRHLDRNVIELGRRCRALRQEEITEEIEVILLTAEGPTGTRSGLGAKRRGRW